MPGRGADNEMVNVCCIIEIQSQYGRYVGCNGSMILIVLNILFEVNCISTIGSFMVFHAGGNKSQIEQKPKHSGIVCKYKCVDVFKCKILSKANCMCD